MYDKHTNVVIKHETNYVFGHQITEYLPCGRTETLIVAGLIVLSKQYQVSHYQRLCHDRTENAICH